MNQSEHDELLAARAMAAHYVQDEDCTPARAIVRQGVLIDKLKRALEEIAATTGSDDPCRWAVNIARAALAPNAQVQPLAVGKSAGT